MWNRGNVSGKLDKVMSYIDSTFSDHGIFRIFWRSWASLPGKMYRSNQPYPHQLKNDVKKYKKHEVAQSSTGAAAGWSGTMRSTVGGDIQPRANFNGGGRSYLIAVTIGGGIDGSVKDKLKQELYELFFVLDEYNGTDGGVFFNEESGTNYHTVGLACSKHQFNQAFAGKLIQIMNG